MRQYSIKREYFKKKGTPIKEVLLSTSITHGDVFRAFIIDAVFFLVLVIGIFLYTFNGSMVYIGFIFWLILHLLFRLIFKGVTLGMYIIGIRYASLDTYQMFKSNDHITYFKNTLSIRFQFNNTYEMLSYWLEETHQTPAMKSENVILVKKSEYNKFKKDYDIS